MFMYVSWTLSLAYIHTDGKDKPNIVALKEMDCHRAAPPSVNIPDMRVCVYPGLTLGIEFNRRARGHIFAYNGKGD